MWSVTGGIDSRLYPLVTAFLFICNLELYRAEDDASMPGELVFILV